MSDTVNITIRYATGPGGRVSTYTWTDVSYAMLMAITGAVLGFLGTAEQWGQQRLAGLPGPGAGGGHDVAVAWEVTHADGSRHSGGGQTWYGVGDDAAAELRGALRQHLGPYRDLAERTKA